MAILYKEHIGFKSFHLAGKVCWPGAYIETLSPKLFSLQHT